MDTSRRDSVDKSKMKRTVRECQREDSDSNISGDESTEKVVPKRMASRKKIKSMYKCSHCFLIYRTVDGIMQHLLTHQTKEVTLSKTSKIFETNERKIKNKNLPTCTVIITRCDNLISRYQPIGTVNTSATKIQEGVAIDGKTLPRSKGVKPGKANILIESSLKQTSNCGIITKVGMKPHKCPWCTKSFTRPGHLKIHIRTHTGEQPHQCQLCSKSFAQLGNLKIHIRTHTGERFYQCQSCSKSFAQKGNLKSHIRTHTGERPHLCQLCSKSFRELESLKTHIRTHTGERPYQCQLCSKSFGQLGSLKWHMQIHNAEKPQE